jgi:hypothetical protein
MGTLFGFAVGYILGARAGQKGFEEVVRSMQAIRRSEEFQGFVSAMKDHSRHVLREVTGRLAPLDDEQAVLLDTGDHRPNIPF